MKKRMGRKNVHPGVWGPPAWAFLKSSAEACDAESARAYLDFFRLLPQVLPCERCREHCSAYLRAHPVDVEDLPGWVARFEASVAETKRAEQPGRGAPAGRWLGAALCAVAFAVLLLALLTLPAGA